MTRHSDEPWNLPEPEQRLVTIHSDGKRILRDERTGRSFEVPAGMAPITLDSSLIESAQVLGSNEGVALVGRDADNLETCRVVRYDPSGTILSDASFGCASSWDGPYLSPDGNLVAANVLPKTSPDSPGEYHGLTAVSVFDAVTGEELFRIKSAFYFPSANHLRRAPETFWLPDSSGLVVTTARSNRIVTAAGEWAPLPEELRGKWFVPGPTEPLRFLINYDYYTLAVLDEDGELVASVTTEVEGGSEEPPDSFLVVSPAWGATSQEVHVAVWYQGPTSFIGLTPLLPPVIERAPIEERLLVRVATNGACLGVQEEPGRGAGTVTCLEDGSAVEVVEFGRSVYDNEAYWTDAGYTATSESGCPSSRCTWLYIRTDDGTEGWVLSDHLRWARGEPLPEPGG